MDPENIAAFFRSRGVRVIKTRSCWWYNEYHQGYIYQSFPLHYLVDPNPDEAATVFREAPKALALRSTGTLDGSGKDSFLWVRRKPYELSILKGNIRNNIRRGLKHCQIRAISFNELVEKGWDAHQDTLKRHGKISGSLGLDAGLGDCPAYEAWGAFVDDQLAAYQVTLQVGDWAYLIVNRTADSFRKYHPNNALIYSVVAELLSRPDISTVTQGVGSLVEKAALDYSKSSMGFQKEPVRQRIIIRPSLRFLANKHTCRLVIKILSPFPLNYRLQQLLGLCRIVAEG